MAARKVRTSLSDEWRERIKTAALLDLLQQVAVTGKYKKAKIDPIRVTCAQILLRKVMPDLLSTELTGKGGGPIKTETMVDDELARRLLPEIAAGRTPSQTAQAEPNGTAQPADGLVLLGEAGTARANGHG